MKKLLLPILTIAVLFCGCGAGGGGNYKAEGLTTANESDGWKCTFKSMNGSYSNGFNINSSMLRIESSVQSGSMKICLTGGGEIETYNGENFSGSIPVDKFGGKVVYVTLKCEDAKNGKVHLVWEE